MPDWRVLKILVGWKDGLKPTKWHLPGVKRNSVFGLKKNQLAQYRMEKTQQQFIWEDWEVYNWPEVQCEPTIYKSINNATQVTPLRFLYAGVGTNIQRKEPRWVGWASAQLGELRGLGSMSHEGQEGNGELYPAENESSLQSIWRPTVCNGQLILSRGFIHSFAHHLLCASHTHTHKPEFLWGKADPPRPCPTGLLCWWQGRRVLRPGAQAEVQSIQGYGMSESWAGQCSVAGAWQMPKTAFMEHRQTWSLPKYSHLMGYPTENEITLCTPLWAS